MKRDKLLLKVERLLIPEDQPGDQLEGDQHVDGLSVPNRSPMLHNIHAWYSLNISRAPSTEVKVKSSKIHLSEVLAIVHVGKVVNVGGLAEVVGDALLVEAQGGKEVRLDSGADQPKDPVEVKESNNNKKEEEEIEDHGEAAVKSTLYSLPHKSTS